MTTGDQTDADGTDDQGKQAVQADDHGHDQPGAPGDSTPTDSTTADGTDWSTYSGPVWSAAEAARRCGIPRSTLTRRLAAGAIPGAHRDADGWHIPAMGLAVAGIATVPPADDSPADGDQGHGDADAAATAQVAALAAELETERARREGAERLAEERAARITDLQTALRALAPAPADRSDDSGHNGHQDTPTAPPTPQTAVQDADQTTQTATPAPQPRRGLFARLRDALTAD